jgi:hypothetical protein
LATLQALANEKISRVETFSTVANFSHVRVYSGINLGVIYFDFVSFSPRDLFRNFVA